ncbi:hypothetical protein acsn021_06460 [Anaerocolumna cellulosilytica]|uniref:Uncharacterized protein n=1 Tax=Anaerocolumna cellulosilytica TaxID=433286 RepID=A0A6S6QYX7_9FIRM|nr:hypothetical protein acsn021_06460 [Anaerocolumna cellulosilytica]
MSIKPANPEYIPKSYERIKYPRQRNKVDVKYALAVCAVGDCKRAKILSIYCN